MAFLALPFKDPEEVLDYIIDWAPRLAGDTIVSSTFTIAVGTGLNIDSDTFTDTTTTIWLSAGTLGQTYQITNHIITDGNREMDQTVTIKIKAK